MAQTFKPLSESTASAALASHGIPEDFPVRACFFNEWVLSFAEREGCTTLVKLAATTLAADVLNGTKKIPKFDVTSARAVLDFQKAVAGNNRAWLQQHVPLSLARGGIDLGQAAWRTATACALGLDGLVKRLVKGETLEQVGAWKVLTRERVRQIEKEFINFLNAVLDGIPREHTKRWEEWERTGSVGEVETDESDEVSSLVQAALHHAFSRRPEADVIRVRQFQLAEEAADALALVPDMYAEGVNAQEILARHFPALRWHRFLEWNAMHSRFILRDNGASRIAKPKACDVVAALLSAHETRPRKIINFLLKIPDLWAWPHDSLANNCAEWRKSPAFPPIELAAEEPDLSLQSRSNAEIDTQGLIDFVRQTGPRGLISSRGTQCMVEAHRDGLVIVSGAGHGRRFDFKTLQSYVEVYGRTKSKKTTAYGSGFHSTYFISLVEAYERERPYAPAEIDPVDLDIILNAKPTERIALLQNRIGQGRFRETLIANRRACYVTGLADARFLRASHIKPWRDCGNDDRLDWRNGLLLTPNLDLLFDHGLISFDDDGTLLISSQLPEDVQERFGLKPGFKGSPLCEKTRTFLIEHRTKCFHP